MAAQQENREKAVIILTTASPENGRTIARTLVERKLAACVNMTLVRSVYRWKGDICDDQELLLVIKTRESLAENVMAVIRGIHSYDLPEMIVVPVNGGYPPYLSWLYEETAG
jgi:periplasmic divalent cation tolerance protein